MFMIVCDACGKTAPAFKARIYHVMPTGWFLGLNGTPEKATAEQHVCSEECIPAAEARLGPEVARWILWREITRDADRPRVGQENCKVCARLKNPPCLFHRPRKVAT